MDQTRTGSNMRENTSRTVLPRKLRTPKIVLLLAGLAVTVLLSSFQASAAEGRKDMNSEHHRSLRGVRRRLPGGIRKPGYLERQSLSGKKKKKRGSSFFKGLLSLRKWKKGKGKVPNSATQNSANQTEKGAPVKWCPGTNVRMTNRELGLNTGTVVGMSTTHPGRVLVLRKDGKEAHVRPDKLVHDEWKGAPVMNVDEWYVYNISRKLDEFQAPSSTDEVNLLPETQEEHAKVILCTLNVCFEGVFTSTAEIKALGPTVLGDFGSQIMEFASLSGIGIPEKSRKRKQFPIRLAERMLHRLVPKKRFVSAETKKILAGVAARATARVARAAARAVAKDSCYTASDTEEDLD